jgi:hypothetical protein
MNDFLQSLRNGQAEKQRTPKTRKSYDNSYQYSSGPRFHNYGNSYQPPRTAPMKRTPVPGAPSQPGNQITEEQNLSMLADVLDNLVTQVDSLVKNQEYMITVQERTADLLQRQADAIEMVMAHFNISPDMQAPTFENHYVSSQEPEEELDGTVEELLKAELEAEKLHKTTPAAKPRAQAKPVIRKRRKVVSPPPARTEAPAKDGNTRLMGRDEIMEIINSMRAEGATYDQVAKRLIDLGQPTFSGRGEWHAQTIHRLCSRG